RLLCGCLLVLAVSLAGPAAGQVVVQPVGLFQNPLILAENKEVQKDLQLSDEQLKKLAGLSAKQAEGLKGLGFQDFEKRKQVLESSRKALGELLDAAQAKRLKQLELQQ